MTNLRAHWEHVYQTKREDQRSWSQPMPTRSLQLIQSVAKDRLASIIDIGGGTSRLVDNLLEAGYEDLWVLDLSATALEEAKVRLGRAANRVSWIVEDVTKWRPPRTWDVWHDRAVFHFLIDEPSQDAYLTALKLGTTPGSVVIIATFALTGPEQCSGLQVRRYDHGALATRLGHGFRMIAEAGETHTTPSGSPQDFIYAVFERTCGIAD